MVHAFLKKWWVESDFKAPNLPFSLRLKVSGCHYNSIYNNTWTKHSIAQCLVFCVVICKSMFVLFLMVTALSILLRFTASDLLWYLQNIPHRISNIHFYVILHWKFNYSCIRSLNNSILGVYIDGIYPIELEIMDTPHI